MQNFNHPLDLNTAPNNIRCEQCPAACCRAGVIIPLTDPEVDTLKRAGTQLEPFEDTTKAHAAEMNTAKKSGRLLYTLITNCGNLKDVDGTLRCSIWHTPEYPRACSEFITAGFSCAALQLARIKSGEDTQASLDT